MVRGDAGSAAIRGDDMRRVSGGYRPFPVVRDVDFKISFSVMDMNAKKDSTAVDTSDDGVFCNIHETVDEVNEPGGKYASLERNLWVLDGTFDMVPDDAAAGPVGFWSSMLSDAEGVFVLPPVIRYTFADKLSTLGWTLHFDAAAGQFASRVRVTTYGRDGVTVLDTGEYDNEAAVMAVQHYAGDYYAVEFAFLSTSEPMRRLRLMEVDFGLTKAYDRNSLGEVHLVYGADILARSLPTRELVFTFDNSDLQYNLLNPDGVYQYLQDGQVITASAVIGGVSVDMGCFYFTRADVTQSGIAPQITAHDRLYRLDGTTFEGGTGERMTLAAAVAAVLDGYDIPVCYRGGAGEVWVTLSTPGVQQSPLSVREALQMLAQAAMCTAYIDRDGVLCFGRLELAEEPCGEITADELYDYSGVTIADKVDGVTLMVMNEYEVDEDGEPIRHVYTAGSFAIGAMTQTFKNACVAPENGEAVAAWLLAGLQRRKSYAVKNRCDPAVEIGDTLRIDDIFKNRETAVVTGLEIEYDGVLSAITKGVGA